MKVRVASAGTGKTTALVFRYLELLAEYPPHRIAAVTFTRAAAAQLRDAQVTVTVEPLLA